MPSDKVQLLKDLAELLNRDTVTVQEFGTVFKAIVETVKRAVADMKDVSAENKQIVSDTLEQLYLKNTALAAKLEEDNNKRALDLQKDIQDMLKTVMDAVERVNSFEAPQ